MKFKKKKKKKKKKKNVKKEYNINEGLGWGAPPPLGV